MVNTNTRALLKFNFGGNAKLSKDIVTFSLPSGFSCPGAQDCLAKADKRTGKITDGPLQKYRCFSAVSETRPAVRAQRWYNFDLLKKARTKDAMVALISASFPVDAKILRLHVGGDFFSQNYFDAWKEVAAKFKDCVIYAYTKSTHFVYASGVLPDNFKITLSKGGKYDHLVDGMVGVGKEDENTTMQYGVAEVLGHPEEAQQLGLTVDHDDSHAIAGKQHFALLLHSMQPAGSAAAAKVKRMRTEGVQFSYPSK